MRFRLVVRGLLGALLLSSALVGCRGGDVPQEPLEASAETVTYSVRGRVLEAWQGDRLAVRHEAISDFRGVSGDLQPMAEMSMRFPLVEGLAAETLAVGDLIAFELNVDWSRRPPHRIESFERLTPETTLDLER